MKKIKLANTNKYALIDDCDFESVSKFKWHLDRGRNGRKADYAWRSESGGKKFYMHREIMGATTEQTIDHISNNKLDNRRSNLRFCTRSENQFNKGLSKNNTSGFKGVCFKKREGKWSAKIASNHKRYDLGLFNTAEDAARAYNEAAKKYHGEFARLNVV